MPNLSGIFSYFIAILYVLPAVVVGLSFHEWAHAFAALKMGDPTARNLGRLTVNPLAHIDPMGFLMMLLVGFGWAKPVPVNPRNYRNYRTGEIVVSLAGVTMNLIIAVISAFVYGLINKLTSGTIDRSGSIGILLIVINYFIIVNLSLMVFNLIPIYPLDGYHVFEVLLIKRLGPKPFTFLRRYGRYILIGVLLLGRIGFSFVGTAAGFLYQNLMKLVSLLLGANLF